MKVLFLDFDGVLNSAQEVIYHRKGKNDGIIDLETFCPIACSNLQALLARMSDLKIVISSTWRFRGKDGCAEILNLNGIDGSRVIDITPRKPIEGAKGRGDYIQAWLDKHPEVTQFAIIDDDSDMCHLMDHFFKIDNFHGLQLRTVQEILKYFGEDTKLGTIFDALEELDEEGKE